MNAGILFLDKWRGGSRDRPACSGARSDGHAASGAQSESFSEAGGRSIGRYAGVRSGRDGDAFRATFTYSGAGRHHKNP